MQWTPNDDERLIALMNEGLTSIAIATQFGVRKGAVMGRVRRLRVQHLWKHRQGGKILDSKKKEYKQNEQELTANTTVRRILIARAKVKGLLPDIRDFTIEEHEGPIVTLMDLDNNKCHWPIGQIDMPDFTFCGATIETKPPYCDKHRELAYAPRRYHQKNS